MGMSHELQIGACAAHCGTPRIPHLIRSLCTSPQGLVRAYTKKVGARPDFDEPIVLSDDRGGITVEDFCVQIHQSLVAELKYALVWGTSAKHMPQRCVSRASARRDGPPNEWKCRRMQRTFSLWSRLESSVCERYPYVGMHEAFCLRRAIWWLMQVWTEPCAGGRRCRADCEEDGQGHGGGAWALQAVCRGVRENFRSREEEAAEDVVGLAIA